jgi:hypothetical protein
MQVLSGSRRDLILFGAAVGYGMLVFQAGFRFTGEVLPVLSLLALGSIVFGFVVPRHPWLWGLGIGIGTRLLPEPALSQEHILHERPAHPLPLPFNLTGSSFAQWVAASLLIMSFPFVAAMAGWMIRKLATLAARMLQAVRRA